jgi:hypothetical protein
MKKIVFITFISFITIISAFGQYRVHGPINKQELDFKPIHWGFTFGVSRSSFIIYKSADFLKSDSINILGIEGSSVPGFFLGPVFNVRLGRYFDLRFLLDISFTQRNLTYYEARSGGMQKEVVSIPSSFIEFPILLKYKGQRMTNVRPYVIAGLSAKYDLASLRKVDNSKPYLKIAPFDGYIEVGPGFDFYFPYFKLSVELKYDAGLVNLIEIHNTLYSKPIDALRSNMFMLSFHFEG